MTWAEICEDKLLANLPYRIETDRWGHVVMSPPPRREHSELQGEIVRLLGLSTQGGHALAKCPLETSEGVKAVDVAWVSRSRRASQLNQACYLVAPEICAEIESPSNSRDELMERKRLYFEKGAQEFWLCDLNGRMTFFDPAGEITARHSRNRRAKIEVIAETRGTQRRPVGSSYSASFASRRFCHTFGI